MTRSALAVVLTLALAAPLPAEDAVARGKQLYQEQNCRMCHNLGGVGNPKGVALDEVGGKHSTEALKMWLTNPKEMAQKAGSTRKPPMKSFATLPAADVDALVSYLSTLRRK